MSLKDEIKSVIGRRRRYLLLRVADTDVESARKLCGIPKGTYNSWLRDETFVELHQHIPDWSAEYKQEAIQLLRRTNQLQAVLLEEQIITKMKAEIESGIYNLIRTNLAKTVYEKLISDLDYTPENLSLSWEQRFAQIITNQPHIGGEEHEVIETTYSESPEHQESQPEQISEQGLAEG